MTGTPGEALDTDEAMRALDAANRTAQDASFDALAEERPWEWSFELLSALNAQGVVLVWEGDR